jgi:hypothetical protein
MKAILFVDDHKLLAAKSCRNTAIARYRLAALLEAVRRLVDEGEAGPRARSA